MSKSTPLEKKGPLHRGLVNLTLGLTMLFSLLWLPTCAAYSGWVNGGVDRIVAPIKPAEEVTVGSAPEQALAEPPQARGWRGLVDRLRRAPANMAERGRQAARATVRAAQRFGYASAHLFVEAFVRIAIFVGVAYFLIKEGGTRTIKGLEGILDGTLEAVKKYVPIWWHHFKRRFFHGGSKAAA